MMKLMDRCGLTKNETIYVGDTAGDKEAAQFAGIKFLYAAYGFGNLEGEPFIANSPNYISNILSNII